jgi:Protein of unknown function (DUF4231)
MFGVGRDPAEVGTLEKLLSDRVSHETYDRQGSTIGTTETAIDDPALDVRLKFINLQFAAPMRNYTRWGGWYAAAFTALSLAALVSGLTSSGIAAGWSSAHWARWTILLLGLVAAISAVLNQVWRPGQKSSSRTKGGNALRREAWEYLNRIGRYQDLQAEPAFALFATQVSAIVRGAEEVDEALPPISVGDGNAGQ